MESQKTRNSQNNTIFIHLSISENFGFSHVLVVVSNAVMNMRVQMSLWDINFISFSSISESGIAGSCGSSIFHFFRKFHTFSPVAVPRLHSHWLHKCSLFSIYPHQHLLFLIFLMIGTLIDLSWYLTHCGFALHFPDE